MDTSLPTRKGQVSISRQAHAPAPRFEPLRGPPTRSGGQNQPSTSQSAPLPQQPQGAGNRLSGLSYVEGYSNTSPPPSRGLDHHNGATPDYSMQSFGSSGTTHHSSSHYSVEDATVSSSLSPAPPYSRERFNDPFADLTQENDNDPIHGSRGRGVRGVGAGANNVRGLNVDVQRATESGLRPSVILSPEPTTALSFYAREAMR